MKRGQKAWLLLWEWAGDHAAVEDSIAAILQPRLSQRFIGKIVEILYAIHAYSPMEQALWSKRPKDNPYKVYWENGYCYCGHNPSLYAHYVHNFIITENSMSGIETISWIFPPLYRWNNTTGQMEQIRGALPKSIKRTITGPLSDREIGRYNQDKA
jgi:hypothetical protein